MMTIDELAVIMGTDKSSKQHNYTPYYEMFFSRMRDTRINLMEVGIDEGNSLRMWNEYFWKGEIHGIDIRDDYDYLRELGIYCHIADQSNKADLVLFGEQYNDYFDIIIDDGSHQSSDMILTFETLFPYLKSGGYYCIEDLLCDQDPRWNKGESVVDRIKQMITEVNMSGNIPNSHLCANKREVVKKYDGTYFDKNIEWVFNSCGLCIIKKL